MAKARNLTPSMQIPSAENELVVPFTTDLPLGQRQGGVNMYSNSFKRGYGNSVFGSDENGVWLGAADFTDAPLKMYMDGTISISNDDGTNQSLINEKVLIFYKSNVPRIVIGIPD